MRTPTEHIKTLQRRVDFLKAREHRNSYDAAELGSLEWALVNLPQQRAWVGLDPEEIRKTNHHMIDGAYHYSFKQGAEWAEAKLKEKNNG